MTSAELATLDPLIARLKEHCQPLQIWLFGSRARGEARPDSDWDLAAVLPDESRDELYDPAVLWKLLRQDEFGADVLVFPKSEFDEDRTTPNTIPFAVVHEGILLDER
ncbi:MAG: nucleotidyltransferase domain-containing protein [Myxococcota bacterium]